MFRLSRTLALTLLPFGLLLGLLTGCPNSNDECQTDDDCFATEVCAQDNECVPRPENRDTGSSDAGDTTTTDAAEDGRSNDGGENDGGGDDGGTACSPSCEAYGQNSLAECVDGSCRYFCEEGYVDANGDYTSGNPDENSDGCEYQCTESNGGTEICDGKDNDCDGTVDENLTQECPLQEGVCSGTEVACQGGSYPECTESDYPDTYTPNADSATGDAENQDNDCDGVVDNQEFSRAYYEAFGHEMPPNSGVAKGIIADEGDATFFVRTQSDGVISPLGKVVEARRTDGTLATHYVGGNADAFTKGTAGPRQGIAYRPNGGLCAAAFTRPTSGGNRAAKISCFDSSENRTFSDVLSSPSGPIKFQDVAVDPSSGAVYAVGGSEVDLEGNSNAGSNDVLVRKYDSSGAHQWTQLYGRSGTEGANGVVVDPSRDAIYVAGAMQSELAGRTTQGSWDGFLMRLNPSDGTREWLRYFGAGQADRWWDVTFDAERDSILVSGDISGDPPNANQYKGNRDGAVAAYAPDGDRKWFDLFGTPEGEQWFRLAVHEPSGSIYVAGHTEGDLDDESVSGYRDALIVKYDAEGNQQWRRLEGADGGDAARGIAVDSTTGDVYISGWTQGNFACPSSTDCGGQGGFVLRRKYEH